MPLLSSCTRHDTVSHNTDVFLQTKDFVSLAFATSSSASTFGTALPLLLLWYSTVVCCVHASHHRIDHPTQQIVFAVHQRSMVFRNNKSRVDWLVKKLIGIVKPRSCAPCNAGFAYRNNLLFFSASLVWFDLGWSARRNGSSLVVVVVAMVYPYLAMASCSLTLVAFRNSMSASALRTRWPPSLSFSGSPKPTARSRFLAPRKGLTLFL